MAPSTARDSPISLLSTRDRHKCFALWDTVGEIDWSDADGRVFPNQYNVQLRKPAVEKMRRDRINSCIEQLKVLLEKEFHKQDPNAKLEKADVLEMTVAFLKQQLQPQRPANHATAHGDGYSHCWKETLHFLSASSLKEVTLPPFPYLHAAPALSSHIQAAAKQPAGPDRVVWRPW